MTRPYNNQQQQKKRTYKIVDFAVLADHNKIERKWNDKYLELTRELKKVSNMNVTFILIVIGALGTVTKWLFKGVDDLEVGERVETIKTTA